MTDTSTNERRAMCAETRPLSIQGTCIRMGDDGNGHCRLIIRVDKNALLRLHGNLLYRSVNVSTLPI